MIRAAVLSDIPEIVRMGEAFCRASGHPVPFDPESFAASVVEMLASPAFIVLVTDGGMLIGFVQGALANRNHIQASEIVWWVDEDKRGTGAGLALFREFERIAREKGAQSFTVTRQVELEAERVDAIYRRMGYRPTDVTYVKGEAWGL